MNRCQFLVHNCYCLVHRCILVCSMLCVVFGLACHIGVQLELPAVGIAKSLYHVDGIENNEEHHEKVCDILCKTALS